MRITIVVLFLLLFNNAVIAEEVNFADLYFKKKQEITFDIPSADKAFIWDDYNHKTIYPFLKRWIGKEAKYKSHPLFEVFCKGIAKTLPKEEYAVNIKKAVKYLKKDKSDVISAVFLYYNSQNSFTNKEWIKIIRSCRRTVDYNSFLNFFLVSMFADAKEQAFPTNPLRRIAFRMAEKNSLNKRDSQYICRLILSGVNYCDDKTQDILRQTLKIKESNVWLRKTLLGVAYTGLAWEARGGDWGDKVSQKGWQGFEENLKKAEKNLTEAWNMHQDLPEPAALMVRVSMGNSSMNDRITWFNRAVKAQADYYLAYENIDFALRPRWCGSVDLLIKLGNACYNSKLYKARIPNKILQFYKNASSECHGYSWQNVYQQTGALEKLDKILHRWCIIQGGDNEKNRNFYLASKAMINFYAGNYQETQKIISQMGEAKFKTLESALLDYNNKYFPSWIKTYESIKYFTGKHGQQLVEAEKQLLAGNQLRALEQLKNILKDKKLDSKERAFIADLWGRYTLGNSAYNYYNGSNSLILAAKDNNIAIMSKLIKLGINLDARDNKGATALYRAVCQNNDDAVKILLKAGAKTELRGDNNTTPLMIAIHQGCFKNVKLLVDSGADVNAKVGKYRIWDYVKYANDPQITKLLKAHGAK